MHLHLDDRLILVTGSTSGIGREIAVSLLKENASVIINGRSKEKVDKTIRELSDDAYGTGKIYGFAADVSTQEGVELLCNSVQSIAKPLYALVNNTGVFSSQPFLDISDQAWKDMFNTNVMSGVLLSKKFLNQFLSRNEGTILFVSSEAGYASKGLMVHYSMTKSAQLAISRGLAEVTKGTNVRVNSILPGPTWTEGIQEYVEGLAKSKGTDVHQEIRNYFQNVEPSSLIQRFATSKEIADVATFLISPITAAVNGRSWLVDGGIIQHI